MTTPAEFLQHVSDTLKYLDTQLSPGSAVFFAPLVDGRLLYNTLSQRQHPVGVTYAHLYDYLNCLQTSPWCVGSESSTCNHRVTHFCCCRGNV